VRGFTYIELMVTLAIMAVLAMMAVPSAHYEIQREKEQALREALMQIRQGIDNYKHASDVGRIQKDIDATGYPPSLGVLVQGVPDQTTPDHRMLYFMRRIPADPLFPDSKADPASTWGLRSYASPPDAPAEGDDVFDIYSRSTQTGLNGVPYKDW